jgi:hypothetical protein
LKPGVGRSDKLIPGLDTDPFVPSGVLGVAPAAVALPAFLVLRLPCSIGNAEAQISVILCTLRCRLADWSIAPIWLTIRPGLDSERARWAVGLNKAHTSDGLFAARVEQMDVDAFLLGMRSRDD